MLSVLVAPVVSAMTEILVLLPFAAVVPVLKTTLVALHLLLMLSSAVEIVSLVLLVAGDSCGDLLGVHSFDDSQLDNIVDVCANLQALV